MHLNVPILPFKARFRMLEAVKELIEALKVDLDSLAKGFEGEINEACGLHNLDFIFSIFMPLYFLQFESILSEKSSDEELKALALDFKCSVEMAYQLKRNSFSLPKIITCFKIGEETGELEGDINFYSYLCQKLLDTASKQAERVDNTRLSVLERRHCDETLELLAMFVERPLGREVNDRLLHIEKLLHEEAGIDVTWALLRSKENDEVEADGKDG